MVVVAAIHVYTKRFKINYFDLYLAGNHVEHILDTAKITLNGDATTDFSEIATFIYEWNNVKVNIHKRDNIVVEAHFHGEL